MVQRIRKRNQEVSRETMQDTYGSAEVDGESSDEDEMLIGDSRSTNCSGSLRMSLLNS